MMAALDLLRRAMDDPLKIKICKAWKVLNPSNIDRDPKN
jgi:hypothetical protein